MRRIQIILLLLFAVRTSYAEVNVNVYISETEIFPYEVFQFQIVTNGDCKINPIDFDGLEVLGEPFTSQTNQSFIINGVQSSSVEVSTTYQLRALKPGKFVIPEVTLECEDGTHSSQPITITAKKGKPDYFLTLESNKKSVFEGESFILSLTFYTKTKPEHVENIDLGEAVAVWRQDLYPNKATFSIEQEQVNGEEYSVIRIRDELCFPQKTGKITFPYYIASFVMGRDFFNTFRRQYFSNAVEISVKEIKGTDGLAHKGLVGEFTLASDISATEVEIGEPVELKLTIDGTGNQRQSLIEFGFDFPKTFNSYDPEIIETTTATTTGMNGTITYTYTLVPTKPGTFNIPIIDLDFYDLQDGQMRTLSTQEFDVTVVKPEGYVPTTSAPADTLKNQINEDIKYIDESEGSFFQKEDFIFGGIVYYTLLLSPIFASLLLVFFRRKKDNITEDDLLKSQQKKAIKLALSELKLVEEKMDNNETSTTLKGIQTSLNKYLQQKLNLSLSELSLRQITPKLEAHNLEQSLIGDLGKIWNTIEMGQYAPTPAANVIDTLADTRRLITELDKKL